MSSSTKANTSIEESEIMILEDADSTSSKKKLDTIKENVCEKSDCGSEETIGDLCDDERNELLEQQHTKNDEPPAKKMRYEEGPIVPIPVKRNFYVHVERDLRERAFFMLAKQRCGIQLVQCDLCRANRLHQISQPYGNDHLILVNMCEHCLKTNMDLASLYNTFWPKVDLPNTKRVNHQLSGDNAYEVDVQKDEANPLQRKILSNRLTIFLSQCLRCSLRQADMYSDVFIRKTKEGIYFLSIVQCLSCLCGNDKILTETFKSSWKLAENRKKEKEQEGESKDAV